jgi:hypothetical protein
MYILQKQLDHLLKGLRFARKAPIFFNGFDFGSLYSGCFPGVILPFLMAVSFGSRFCSSSLLL